MINAVESERTATAAFQVDSRRYAKCMEVSARIRWDIDRDVIRGRDLDFSQKFPHSQRAPADHRRAGARMKKLGEALRKFGPYLTVAIFVPGGMVLAPMMWYARRRTAGAL